MEVPRLGAESELQLPADARATLSITQVVSVGAGASMNSLMWLLINICVLRAPGSNIPTGLVYYRECTYAQVDINL